MDILLALWTLNFIGVSYFRVIHVEMFGEKKVYRVH